MKRKLLGLLILLLVGFSTLLVSCTDEVGEEKNYSVSGQITEEISKEGLENVRLIFSGHGETMTGDGGLWFKDNLSGEVTITPFKDCWNFTPDSQTVNDTSGNVDFLAIKNWTYTVSGTVKGIDGNGITEVTLSFKGEYIDESIQVDDDWDMSGLKDNVTITPYKEGWNFIPKNYIVNEEENNIKFIGTYGVPTIQSNINRLIREGNVGVTLQDMVEQRALGILPYNRPYVFNGIQDCYGFVRQVWNPILYESSIHEEDFNSSYDMRIKEERINLPGGLPTETCPDDNWVLFAEPSELFVGDVLATHQGHEWGSNWHGGIYAGIDENGNHMNWDCSSSADGAYERPLYSNFKYYYKPLHDILEYNENYALQFDGADDYIETNTTNVMNSLPLTIEAWVHPEVRTDQDGGYTQYDSIYPDNVISNDNPSKSGHGFGLNVFSTGSELMVQYQSGDFHVIPDVIFNTNQWYHIAVVYTSGNIKTYVNSNLVDDFSYFQGFLDGVNFVKIGKHNDDYYWGTKKYFKGIIDEVRIWSIARSQEEILSTMNTELMGSEMGLEAYWQFNEGDGNSVQDDSGNSLNGTLHNNPEWIIADWK